MGCYKDWKRSPTTLRIAHITKSLNFPPLYTSTLGRIKLIKSTLFPIPHSTCSYSTPLSHTRWIRIPFKNKFPGLHAFSFLTTKQNGFFFFFFFFNYHITIKRVENFVLFFFFLRNCSLLKEIIDL